MLASPDNQPAQQKPTSFLAGRKIEVPPDRYTCDLELHDRYQQFSAQILQLALAGIAVIGFLVATLIKEGPEVLTKKSVQTCFAISAIVFGTSALFALLHKFLASDGLYHHFRAIKHLIIKESPRDRPKEKSEQARLDDNVAKDEKSRNRRFTLSTYSLCISAVLLVVGALVVAVGFIAVMISVKPAASTQTATPTQSATSPSTTPPSPTRTP